jgi:hypothetical protein
MGRMSRQKGKAGERECAAEVTPLFGPARRGVQYSGGPDSPDVHLSDSDLHIEVKRVERPSLWAWVTQARRDAAGRPWCIYTRKNREEPLLIIPLAHMVEVARQVVLHNGMGEYAEQHDPVADGWVGKDGMP